MKLKLIDGLALLKIPCLLPFIWYHNSNAPSNPQHVEDPKYRMDQQNPPKTVGGAEESLVDSYQPPQKRFS